MSPTQLERPYARAVHVFHRILLRPSPWADGRVTPTAGAFVYSSEPMRTPRFPATVGERFIRWLVVFSVCGDMGSVELRRNRGA